MDNKKNTGPEIMVLKFADSKIPVFKESRNKDYIKYGDDNQYPSYLTHLFNKSAKHNAIVNGKAKYIFGGGFINGDVVVNRLGETMNDVTRKAILDIELYGGYRFEVIWNRAGKVSEIYHTDYATMRKGKETGWWFKQSWESSNRDEETFIESFDPSKPVGRQVFSYDEYRPGQRYYPLPSYIGCNNYIETDVEIGKYNLSIIRNGMMPSKMIQFFQGEPDDEGKDEIERSLKNKFAGSETAGRFVLVFNEANAQRAVEITDLSSSEMADMFIELNKTCAQEIFSGHSVTSPALFGIKTEGQLGATNELKVAYEIFVNTYAKPKADAFEKDLQYLLKNSVFAGDYVLQPLSPIGVQIPDALLEKALSPDDIRTSLGLPVTEKVADTDSQKLIKALSAVSPLVATKILETLSKNEIRGIAGLPPEAGGDVIPTPEGTPEGTPAPAPGVAPVTGSPTLDADPIVINENIKNLTGKQHIQVMRIIREYGKGKLTEAQAKTMLQVGYGLTDTDINALLGIQAPAPVVTKMSMDQNQLDEIVEIFDEYGSAKSDFEILKSKKVSFSHHLEAEADEAEYIQEAFATVADVTVTEKQILDLIAKDPKVTPEVIAQAIKQTKKYVVARIESLVKRGYLEIGTETVGVDSIIVRTVPSKVDIVLPPTKKQPAEISIKYSYEPKPGQAPVIATSRPFCIKMIELDRLYSRREIELISERLGYSVFDRKGGWWGDSPECRHRWASHIVVKKGGTK